MLEVELLHITGLFFFPSATFLIFHLHFSPSVQREERACRRLLAASQPGPTQTAMFRHVFFLFPVICGSGEGSRHAATFKTLFDVPLRVSADAKHPTPKKSETGLMMRREPREKEKYTGVG